MPFVKVTSRSQHMSISMHYIATGVKDVTKGRINKPKVTAQNDVDARNYLMEGIHCRGFILPGMSSKNMMHQYHLGQADMRYYLNQRPNIKNQSDNIVISFKPGELDWRNPNDLMAGRWIVHHFVEDAFPTNAVYTGYQMDNPNKISHVHLAVNMIDEKTGLSDDKNNYFGGWKMQRVEEHVTKAWNRLHPDKYIEPWKISMHHHTLMPKQKQIVDRTKPFIKHGTDFYDLHQEAPKHGVILNAFRKNGEKIIGKGLHDTNQVNGYAVHLIHHHHMQNKPLFMTGNMLSEYIPGVKTRQLKKTMHINTLHAKRIQYATAKLERISNTNQIMSNQTISNATSARSSASLNMFKSNLVNSANQASSREASQVTTMRVARANHIIDNMTHNDKLHQAHIINGTSEKAQQRSQAVMTMQYHDIDSSANQELEPDRSAEHTYQSHANQLHNLQASLLTSYANRSLASTLASSAVINSYSLATQSLLHNHNQSLINKQIKRTQSIKTGYNVINKINSYQSSQLNHQLEHHQSIEQSQSPIDFTKFLAPNYYNDYQESYQSNINSNSIISHSTNSGLNSSVTSNSNIITKKAQSQIDNNKKPSQRAIKKQNDKRINSKVASQVNTSLIIPDMMQEFKNSLANNKHREEQSFSSDANHQQGFQASLSNIRDAYVRDSVADAKSFDNSILSSAVSENTSNNIKITSTSKKRNHQRRLSEELSKEYVHDVFGSNNVNQSNVSRPANQNSKSLSSNHITSNSNTQTASQSTQDRLQSMDNSYKKLFASSASNEQSNKRSYINSVFDRNDVTAYLNSNMDSVMDYAKHIQAYANLNGNDLVYVTSKRLMHNLKRKKQLQQQRQSYTPAPQEASSDNNQTKRIRQAERDYGGIGGR